MKILLATDNFYPNVNGAANFTLGLAKGLMDKHHQISVIAPASKFKDTVANLKGITVYGIRSVMVPKIIHPAKVRIPLTLNPPKIKKIITRINPDIIHIQDHFMIGSMVAKIGKQMSIPIIGTNHFMPENLIHYLYPPGFAKKTISTLAWKQFASIYQELDLITTPTYAAAKIIKQLNLKKPVVPISCGIDLARFNPKNNGDYLKKRYRIPDSQSIILYVGRLDPEKCLDLLIKAFANVLNSIDTTLVLAGKGKELMRLTDLATKFSINKKIIFTGFVPDIDLPNLYKVASIFVITSTAELQSIATMEAMASGLPIIATHSIALPELVKDGKNGFLFSQSNINQLTTQLLKLLQNPLLRKQMSASSLKIIKQHSFDLTIKGYENIYQRFVPSSKSGHF